MGITYDVVWNPFLLRLFTEQKDVGSGAHLPGPTPSKPLASALPGRPGTS